VFAGTMYASAQYANTYVYYTSAACPSVAVDASHHSLGTEAIHVFFQGKKTERIKRVAKTTYCTAISEQQQNQADSSTSLYFCGEKGWVLFISVVRKGTVQPFFLQPMWRHFGFREHVFAILSAKKKEWRVKSMPVPITRRREGRCEARII
jgi:hypothetical protein